jgi:hypothetical protein
MKDLFKTTTLGLAGLGVVAALGLAAPAGAQNIPESSDPIRLAINEWTG